MKQVRWADFKAHAHSILEFPGIRAFSGGGGGHCIPIQESPRGFLGGSVVKNSPTNVGDTGSIPDHGGFHVHWSN